jgi:flagella basal body P-ring formation protein FlgA
MMTLPFLLAVSSPPAGCLAIDTETVLARDIAAIVPAFSSVPGDFLLGFVATSGVPRIFKGVELERLAKNRGVELKGLPDLCIARRTFVPQPEQIRAAMLEGLGIPGAKIEILSTSDRAVPSGELIFPRTGLQPGLKSEVMWGGYVRVGENGKFPVWARARITATMTRIVATVNIAAGKPIQKDQIRLEACEDSPLDQVSARTLDEVVGYAATTYLKNGLAIRKTQLEHPADVSRGDLVKVEVFAGSAHLVTEGRAETAGLKGASILIRNPVSGKDYWAQVTGKGQVTVQ